MGEAFAACASSSSVPTSLLTEERKIEVRHRVGSSSKLWEDLNTPDEDFFVSNHY